MPSNGSSRDHSCERGALCEAARLAGWANYTVDRAITDILIESYMDDGMTRAEAIAYDQRMAATVASAAALPGTQEPS